MSKLTQQGRNIRSRSFTFFMDLPLTRKILIIYMTAIFLPVSILPVVFFQHNLMTLETAYYENQKNAILSAKEDLTISLNQISAANNYFQNSSTLTDLLNGSWTDVSNTLFLELVDQVYQQLPESYAYRFKATCPVHPFFCLDLKQTSYPVSLKKALSFIRNNYMKDLSLQSLSEELMLHPNYLSFLINHHLGVNFSYLLDYIRLEKACELLIAQEKMTVAEISYIVGYNNERRLYHAFNKRLGCTPGDFRKAITSRSLPE